MYSQDQRVVRTKNRIFERRRHTKDYRVLKNTLLLLGDTPGKDVIITAEEILMQARSLVEVVVVGDYVRLKGEEGVLRKVAFIDASSGEKMLVLAGDLSGHSIEDVERIYAFNGECIKLMYSEEDDK